MRSSARVVANNEAGHEREPVPSDAKLTVLLVAPTLASGAADAGVVDTVRILCGAGHRVIVASVGGRRAVDIGRLGAEWVPLATTSFNPVVMAANALRLRTLIRRHGCDIVHAHSRASAWSALFAARATGRPLLTTWHKGFREQNPLKHFYNSVMVRGAHVIATSDQIADLIRERYPVATERLSVVASSIDTLRFDPAGVSPARVEAARRVLGIGEKTKLVLVLGRMVRRKGHHVVIEAARRLKARGATDFVCLFANEEGGTRYAGELWDEVLAQGVADCVRLSGPLDDVPAAFAAARVVVSAAIQHEGLPRAILEAQAMARPVIASDLAAGLDAMLAPPGAPPERVSGLRVPAGDAEALAAALIKLFAMPEAAREAMGARGRAFVTANFDPERAAADLLRLYARIAAAGRDGAATAR